MWLPARVQLRLIRRGYDGGIGAARLRSRRRATDEGHMRLILAAVTVALPMAALTGCGTETGAGTVTTATANSSPTAPASASPSVATRSPAASSTVQAYNLLAQDTNRFFAAVEAAEESNPDADPQSAEELLALVDYTFADGVTLSAYDEEHLCFTGPEETYLSLSEHKDDMRRIFGTGECAYDDGDVVLEITFKPGASLRVEERVLEGKDIAEQIPALDGFADVLNEAFASSRVPEGDATANADR